MILRYLSLAWFTKLGYGEFSWLRLTFVFTGCCVWLIRKCKKSSMPLKKEREISHRSYNFFSFLTWIFFIIKVAYVAFLSSN